jgi:hypothetical protein
MMAVEFRVVFFNHHKIRLALVQIDLKVQFYSFNETFYILKEKNINTNMRYYKQCLF